MRRVGFILLGGALLAGVAYCGFYLAGTATHRSLWQSKQPELLWLRHEFGLSDKDFARVCELHAAYRPGCAEMCRRIDVKNAEVMDLLARTNLPTAEIQAKLTEAAELRLECQKRMLQHFIEVSRSMPPEQGQRYLAWVVRNTLLPSQTMMEHGSAESVHSEPRWNLTRHPNNP